MTGTEVTQALARLGPGLYDSHNDASVGHVLLPGLVERRLGGAAVTTNEYGFREVTWSSPKPTGAVRLVLLGDSFVFGSGVEAPIRFGEQLRRLLEEQRPALRGRLEVLHVGVPSWNLVSSANYLRRALDGIDPDLVLHLSLPNDIEDTAGVRGFGQLASFNPVHRAEADSVLEAGFAMRRHGVRRMGYLRHGFDYASQVRYEAAGRAILELREELAEEVIPYRLIFHFRHLLPVVRERLGQRLEGQALYISEVFGGDRSTWVSASDHHWGASGHRAFAGALYELLRQPELRRDLERAELSDLLDLPELDWATRDYERILEQGAREASQQPTSADLLRTFGRAEIRSTIDFRELDPLGAAQIHGGVDAQRRLAPHAALILRNSGSVLRLRGRSLQPERLRGALTVAVDEFPVASIDLSQERFDVSVTVPEGVRSREFVTISLRSDDWVLAGEDWQHCVSVELAEVGLEG